VAKSSNTLAMVLASLDSDKGIDIKSFDLEGRSSIADHMVIATGTSSRHVASMAERLKQKLYKEGYRPRIEGASTGDWVILDAGDVIVHLFRAEVRSFYNLEKLWGTDFGVPDYTFYRSNP
jgi:ribosome-associated protein